MKMKLDKLKEEIEYLPYDAALDMRNKYINRFINKNSEHYKKYIGTFNQCSDGLCYEGYLWDCLIKPDIITFDKIVSYRNLLKHVMIFWDIHSKDKIWIEDYWKFGKDSIVKIDFGNFLDNLDFFPEDVYIFDNSMKWTLVLTHEDNNGIRICAKIGDLNIS